MCDSRDGGLNLFSDIEWTWTSGKYTTTHKSSEWTVGRVGHEVYSVILSYLQAKRGTQALATYTSLKVNAFSKNELATIKFLVDIPNEEKVFLILALMFHDLQLPPVAEPKVRQNHTLYMSHPNNGIDVPNSLSSKQQVKQGSELQQR